MESQFIQPMRILFVSPYESLGDLFRKLIAEYPQFAVDVVVGNLEEGVQQARERLEQDHYSLIISRGGTSELIKMITQIPVIQIPITTSDLLMALKLAERYTEKIAVVGFPSITKYAYEIKELLQRDYEVVSIETVGQIEQILTDLKDQGVSLVLGDFITNTVARSLGINSVLILSSEESIKIVINQALAVAETLVQSEMKLRLVKNILNTQHAFFVIYDAAGEIVEKNLPSDVGEQELLANIRSRLPLFLNGSTQFSTCRIGQNLFAFRSTSKTAQEGYLIVNIYISDWNEMSKNQGVQLVDESVNGPSFFHSTSTSLGIVQNLLNSYRNTDKVVVLIGEDGTGKLAAARTLHRNSIHQTKPYYLIDCYRIHPETFQLNTNQFDTSYSKGTSLIFDNFQDAAPAVKKQILNFIDQERTNHKNRFYLTICSRRSDYETQIDLKDLLEQVTRSFPYLTIELPPLRERKEDLLNLITLYLGELREQYNKPAMGFNNEAIDRLVAYDWPGNMRQLKRVLEELYLRASSYYITERAVSSVLEKEKRIYSQEGQSQPAPQIDLSQPLDAITREVVQLVLHQENMNQTKAAERLGIGRSTIWRILKNDTAQSSGPHSTQGSSR